MGRPISESAAAMDNSRTSDRHKLQEISRIAKLMQSSSVPESRQRSIDNPLAFFPSPLIQRATTILPQLEETGLSFELAEELSSTYIKACNELHSTCESSLRKAVASLDDSITTEMIHSMIRIWSAAHSQRTSAWADSAICRARILVEKAKSRSTKFQARKAGFNHEYTPLLEKYFEYNAYPSAPDRAVLARKSMMTPRQIEVWFQNHRNRAKKDGRPLRKLSSDPLPLELSLRSLEQKMPFFTVPESELKATAESDASDSDTSDKEDAMIGTKYSPSSVVSDDIATIPPPHAFPATFPPSCPYTPFPCKSGKPTFPAPIWSRKPATSLRTRSICDFDDFVEDFHVKLQFREASSRKGGRRNHSPGTNTLRPWFTATHTFMPPAPHPAFICPSSIHFTPSYFGPISAVSAPSSRLHPFRSPSPCSPPTSLIPPTQTPSAVSRKMACLPKRSPTRQSMVHRGVSPTTSEASLLPSSRSCSSFSRISSAGSDSLANRRPSSSSSSSSSSSTLTTPELIPTMLPDHDQSPVTVAGVDFQDLDDLFDEPLNIISPDEGLQLSFPGEHAPGIHPKQPFRFSLELPSPDHVQECS